jgi:hypothetical protein
LINQNNDKKYVMENFNAIEAKVTFVFNTGRDIRAKTILDIEYIYNNQELKSKIIKKWNGNDFYKKGDTIIIYVNPNNENEIKHY